MSDQQLLPAYITAEWLGDVLGHELNGFGATRIGDGLVGMNMRLVLDYANPASPSADAPATLVVKLPSPDPTSRATGVALRNYEREVLFYRDLADTVDIRVAACHHDAWDAATGEFVLVLEDLAPGEQGNQLTGCTVGQARVAVLELARLHGPRWDDPTLADIEWLGRRTGTDDGLRLRELWTMLLPGFLATYSKYLSVDAVELVNDFTDRLEDWIDGRDGPLTITHGDYRLDNLMFESAVGGYPIAAVDWQSPGHGPSLGDVSYFLGAGLLPPQRREVERGLVDQYGEALAGYGIAVDAEWLWRQYRRDAYSGVIMSVIASQIVGSSERSEALFSAMATRHTQHALDVGAAALI